MTHEKIQGLREYEENKHVALELKLFSFFFTFVLGVLGISRQNIICEQFL